MEKAKRDGSQARELGDLLTTAIFTSHLAERRNHGREKLQHDAGANVRHDTESKDGAILQSTTTEHVQKGCDLGSRTSRISGANFDPLVEHRHVHTRKGDSGTNADDDDHRQSEEDA